MFQSILPSLLVLGLAAIAAATLAASRPPRPLHSPIRPAASRALIVALVIQGIHFGEEAVTDFPARLGELLGIPAMPMSFFLAFNVVWLGIWTVSVPGLKSAHTAAYFAAWFLAIAAMVNAIAHPLLAVAAGGYFPGLVSSPVIGAAGVSLWLKLRAATGKKSV
jgi:hypothetical protein